MSLSIVLAFAAPKRYMNDPSCGMLPLGLLQMAASLQEKGHSVRLLHLARFGWSDALMALSDGPPDVVGFSCFTFQRHRTIETARRLREQCGAEKPLIVFGGPHAGPLAEEFLVRYDFIDGIVRGEGEETVAELLDRLEKGEEPAGVAGLFRRGHDGAIVTPPERPLIEDIDRLPAIAPTRLSLSGVNLRHQLRHLVTGRGCTGRCSFCYAPASCKGKVRRFSVGRIMSEIDAFRQRYSISFFSFRDDSFTENRAWLHEFSKTLLKKHPDLQWDCQSKVATLDLETVTLMRQAGCIQIQIGVESGSPKLLKALHKQFTIEQLRSAVNACRQTGMLVSFYLISGIPGETDEDIKKTKKLIEELKPHSLVVSRLVYYPGTELASGIDPAKWFDAEDEELYVRDDPQAIEHDEILQELAEDLEEKEPFTETELKAAIETTRGASPVKLSLAQYYENQEKPEKACMVYQEILDEHPGYLWAELQLGELLLDLQQFIPALHHLENAVEKAPRWPYALSELAHAHEGLEETEEAEALFEKARRLAYDPEA